MNILIILALLVSDASGQRIRLHSIPDPEGLSTINSEDEEVINVTSTIAHSEIIRDSRETKIRMLYERVYVNEEEEIQEDLEEQESLLTRILISEDEDEIQAIIQSLPDESMAKLVIFSNALDYLHKIEELLKHFHANVDLEQDLTFNQRALIGSKLVQIHELIDEAIENAIPSDMENVPFSISKIY